MSITYPHTATSVLLSCIDDRLVQSDAKFAKGIGDAFNPRIAGGGLALLDPAVQAVAMQQLAITYVLADITEVYLQSHTGCGAYKLAGVTFEDDAAEVERLYSDLDEAAENAREAMVQAGAPEDKVVIHTQVVNPAGEILERQ